MTFLPIVDRELRVSARLPATYRNRWLNAGIVAITAVVMLTFGGISAGSAASVGTGMFWVMAYCALIFCLFEGVRKTADCLSEEKREGTLGLLFLTDLRGYDVVLGKLAATSLNSVYGLFSILPILALPLLLGGVTASEFWRLAVALLSNLWFSLCMGIWISAWSWRERDAMGKTTIAIVLVGLLLLWIPAKGVQMFSPIYAFQHVGFSGYAQHARDFWWSLAIVQMFSLGVLMLASRTVVHSWQDRGLEKKRKWYNGRMQAPAYSTKLAQFRRETLDSNPVEWMTFFGANKFDKWILWALVFGTLLLSTILCFSGLYDPNGRWAAPFCLTCIVVNLVFKLRLATQATYFFAEARRNNALEMLMVTPLTVKEIISGQIDGLRRIFLPPILCALGCQIVGITAYAIICSGKREAEPTGILIAILAYLLLFIFDIFAIIYAGMWFGLTCKKEGQAATKTILLVLIAPMFSFILYCLAPLIIYIYPVIWIAVCSSKLHSQLRQIVTQRYDARKN